MSLFSTFTRLLWYRLLNWQMVATVATLVILYQFVLRNEAFLDLIGRLHAKLELRMTGNYHHVPDNGNVLITSHKTKASWELRKGQTSVYAVQGRRPRMEDRFNVVSNIQNTSIFGVFDGHGGEFASDFVEKSIFKAIMLRLLKSSRSFEKIEGREHDKEEDREGYKGGDKESHKGGHKEGERIGGRGRIDLEKVLLEEILNVDRALLEAEKLTGDISGTTLLLATLHNHQLVVANVGDSRGVMCDEYNDVIPLSFDHKPQLANERRRIKEAGGFVSFNGVWRVAGILATSRALGDFPLKDKGFVVADPDILSFDLRKFRPKFIILATDGLWDVFTNEEAVAFISTRLKEAHFGAKSLVLQAYYRGSLDNITVIVVRFAYDKEEEEEEEEERDGKMRNKRQSKERGKRVVMENGVVNNGGGGGGSGGGGCSGGELRGGEVGEKEFVGGGKVVGVEKVVELDDGGVVFKEKDASTLVDTSINEGLVVDDDVVGRSIGVGMVFTCSDLDGEMKGGVCEALKRSGPNDSSHVRDEDVGKKEDKGGVKDMVGSGVRTESHEGGLCAGGKFKRTKVNVETLN